VGRAQRTNEPNLLVASETRIEAIVSLHYY
jgi:hypothetical protein